MRAIITAQQERIIITESGTEKKILDLSDTISLDISDGRGGAVKVGRYQERDAYDLLVPDDMITAVKKLALPAYLGDSYDSIPKDAQEAIKQITWLTGKVIDGLPETKTGTVLEWIAAGKPEVLRESHNPNEFMGVK